MRAYLTLLLSLAAVWGASFMFIEIALDDLEPTTLMAGRLADRLDRATSLMAARGMLGRLRRAGWRAFALGIINSAVPFTLIAWGQQHIDSGVAAIANATVPIWVALLAIWFAQSERATGLRIVGIVLGLVGVAVLGRCTAGGRCLGDRARSPWSSRRCSTRSRACSSSARPSGSTRSRS